MDHSLYHDLLADLQSSYGLVVAKDINNKLFVSYPEIDSSLLLCEW